MRLPILTIAVLLCYCSFAQLDPADALRAKLGEKEIEDKKKLEAPFPLDTATKKFAFIEVVNIDSTSAATLYSRAKLFIANSFVSAKDVVQLADDDTKTVVCKGAYETNGLGSVKFKLTIQCKDNRYRYTITDFTHIAYFTNISFTGGELENKFPDCGRMNMIMSQWKTIKGFAYRAAVNTIAQMKVAMKGSGANDNW